MDSNVPKTKAKAKTKSLPPYRLRQSTVHGSGLFATRAIPKGELVVEYVGERITHEEADRRHAEKADDDGHTWLFTIDSKIVIDAGVGGNESRFINHSCDPNCEVILDDGRPMIEAIRAIASGEELAYDYNLTRSPDDSAEVEKIFACRCGAATCRGTMLAPRKKPKPAKPTRAPKAKAKAKAKAKTKTKAKAKTKTKAKRTTRSKR